MKKYFLYILLLLLIISCNEPLPTEIIKPNVPENAQIDIEVLSPEPDLFDYENGYDTLGFVTSEPPSKTIINVSGIKNSYKRITTRRTTAFAVFIDKNLRIEREDGRLIGFGSRLIGETSFNNIEANVIPRIIKYKWNGVKLDTSLGVAHLLTFNRGSNSIFPFPYGSDIEFKLNPIIGNPVKIIIPSPNEIEGKVNIFGSIKNKDLKIELEWNSEKTGKIEIIVGGMNPQLKVPFPLYKIRVRDSGKITVPRSLIETFPFNRFSQIVFTFARQKFVGDPRVSDKIIVAQSIHNIKVDVQ